MTQVALFPGTFDPLTYGHQDLIDRAAKLFDRLIIAVAVNERKKPLLNLQQRVAIIEAVFKNHKNIQVKGFSNLLATFAAENGANVIVRGVRITSDFEYELQLANMNRSISETLETVFIPPTEKYAFVSSTLVKEIAQMGGDISKFVAPEAVQALQSVKWR
jgi:pantetheine-phosphate adenylyltransferase